MWALHVWVLGICDDTYLLSALALIACTGIGNAAYYTAAVRYIGARSYTYAAYYTAAVHRSSYRPVPRSKTCRFLAQDREDGRMIAFRADHHDGLFSASRASRCICAEYARHMGCMSPRD